MNKQYEKKHIDIFFLAVFAAAPIKLHDMEGIHIDTHTRVYIDNTHILKSETHTSQTHISDFILFRCRMQTE